MELTFFCSFYCFASICPYFIIIAGTFLVLLTASALCKWLSVVYCGWIWWPSTTTVMPAIISPWWPCASRRSRNIVLGTRSWLALRLTNRLVAIACVHSCGAWLMSVSLALRLLVSATLCKGLSIVYCWSRWWPWAVRVCWSMNVPATCRYCNRARLRLTG